jgi:acyl transferase domain-containing protein
VLRGGRGDVEVLREALGRIWANGVGVDWSTLLGDREKRCVDLPTYAFQRQRYWLDAVQPGTGDVAAAGLESAEHPLLGGSPREKGCCSPGACQRGRTRGS